MTGNLLLTVSKQKHPPLIYSTDKIYYEKCFNMRTEKKNNLHQF